MRIDKLHDYFQSLLPAKSKKFEEFYSKAWDPANFPEAGTDCCSSLRGPDPNAPLKLHANHKQNQ
jgi:hypothetical protein